MKITLFNSEKTQEIITLFVNTFTESEGKAEGQLIGNLVSELITTTEQQDVMGFVASSDDNASTDKVKEDDVLGCIFFSRLKIPSHQVAFILSPVAVSTDHQGRGIGQKLIHFGLEHLKSLNVDWVFTYGDPDFYSKVGFKQINEDIVKAPFKLTYPEGWLAQSLNDKPIEAMKGSAHCVKALSNPQYW